MSAANSVANDVSAIWPLVLVIAIRGGIALLCRIRTLTSRLARTDWGWRRILNRERRLARRRELRLFHRVQNKSADMGPAVSDPLLPPEPHSDVRPLGDAAFDADLIGAWGRAQRPYAFQVVDGQYRFRRCGTGSVRLPG